jgi:hypothetical protein
MTAPHPSAFSYLCDDYGNPLAVGCYDCGKRYGGPDWIEAVVPHDIWAQISPTRDEGGLLCINCMARRCVNAGLQDVPVQLTAGPFKAVST